MDSAAVTAAICHEDHGSQAWTAGNGQGMAGGSPAWWQPFQSRAAQSDLPCQAAWARKGEPASADDDALVAEVSDQFEVSPERFHVSGEAPDRGAVDLAVLDLADSGRGDSHLLGDLPLCQPPASPPRHWPAPTRAVPG